MDYFSFYGIKQTLLPDINEIRKTYYKLSKQYHPDFFINEPKDVQADILEKSTYNTQAFQTLSNPDRLIDYVLQINKLTADEKGAKLPSDFLMQMMDLNEEVLELQTQPNLVEIENLNARINKFHQDLTEEMDLLRNNFDKANSDTLKEILKQVQEVHLKMRYLLRLRESLTKIASSNTK